MNYLYAKYKYSNKIKLLRMVAVIAVAIVCFTVGCVRIFGHNIGASMGFNIFSYLVLFGIGGLVVILGFLLIYRDVGIGKIYPMIAIAFGIVFIILIPPFETPDEQDHFGSAYNQSNVILGYGNPYEDKVVEEGFVPYRYMRAEDAKISSANTTTRVDNGIYNVIFDNMGVVSEEGDTKVVALNYNSNASNIVYFLPALGITVARLLHLGFGYVYIFGALLNLILYVLMTGFAIAKIPVGKRVLFLVSLLPITLQQVSSFSYDCILIACVLVVTSLSFFLKYGDYSTRRNIKWNIEIPIIRFTITELLMYVFCGFLLYGIKSGVFLIVLILPIVLCINKKWFQKSNRKVSIPILGLLMAFILMYIVFLGGYERIVSFLWGRPQNIREIYGMEGVAPIEYIYNPGRFFTIIYESLKENFGHYVAQIGGTALGYNRIFITRYVYIFNILLLLLSLVRYKDEKDLFKVGNRILAFLTGLAPILITSLAMLLYWTLPTDTVIMGFQGRYVIPTLSIIMLSIGRWKKIRIPNVDNIFVILMTMSGYVCCISALSYV